MNIWPEKHLVITSFNVQSIWGKIDSVLDSLKENRSDICFLQETWLQSGDHNKVRTIRNKAKHYDYDLISCPRKNKKGGGIGFLYRKHLALTPVNVTRKSTFEVTEAVLRGSSLNFLRLCCIYRTGPRSKKFLVEFSKYLDILDSKHGEPIVCGDFNIHMHRPNLLYTKKFNELLAGKDYVQHVVGSTQKKNGLLDLVLTKTSYTSKIVSISNIPRIDHCTGSDHNLIKTVNNFEAMQSVKEKIQYRNYKNIDLENFKRDILNSKLCNPGDYVDVSNAVNVYDSCLTELINNHAPLISKFVNKDHSPWWNEACRDAQRKRRKAERNFHNNRTQANLKGYRGSKENYKNVINKTCQQFFYTKICARPINVKTSYKYINSLLSRDQGKGIFPSGEMNQNLANALSDHFESKSQNIYSGIQQNNRNYNANDVAALNDALLSSSSETTSKLKKFTPLNNNQIHDIVKSMNQTCCDLDPAPTSLILNCLDELLPIISFIVNQSIGNSEMPMSLKEALINPTLKKLNLDSEDVNNYRPISNLKFLSKIIEKCVYVQLNDYLQTNSLHAATQSGYRKYHSCETAVAKIHNDILTVINKNTHVVLLLLDLSSAFDTVDHNILLNKLENKFGIIDKALLWFKSYLTNRSYRTKVRDGYSSLRWLLSGVPQGSILGPILFTLYIKDLQTIALIDNFHIHSYADDTQIYTEFIVNVTCIVIYAQLIIV